MSEDDWASGFARSLGVFLNGEAIASRDERGERIRDDSFFLLFNADHQAAEFVVPERHDLPGRWKRILDTAEEAGFVDDGTLTTGGRLRLEARSLVVLQAV
jgi:glycogen operon protein